MIPEALIGHAVGVGEASSAGRQRAVVVAAVGHGDDRGSDGGDGGDGLDGGDLDGEGGSAWAGQIRRLGRRLGLGLFHHGDG